MVFDEWFEVKMVKAGRLGVVLGGLLVWGIAWGDGGLFKSGRVWIDTAQARHVLAVEIASTAAARARGLMERDALAEQAGMLFLYDRPQSRWRGFWMYQTRIPLDIAFLDAEGRIFDIVAMQPCDSDDPARCPSYGPSGSYHAALEVNRGYFRARGIGPGDRVEVGDAVLQTRADQ